MRWIIIPVGWLIKETSDKIIIVNYIKITLSTSTEIVYAGRNRRLLNATVQLYARYSTVWLAIMIRYNHLREHIRPFALTGGIVKSWNITPVDNYK